MIIRPYRPEDCKTLVELFQNTIYKINKKDYSLPQIHAWADSNLDLSEWNTSFLAHNTQIAEIDHMIVGFGDIDQTGYLDHLYVHADYQHRGIATALCNELEQSVNTSKIVTHASITARPFFEKRGYQAVKEQQVERNGIFLTNYVMEYHRF